jgi:hypothetical protein
LKLNLGTDWTKKLKGRIEKFEFEVGVIEDKPHMNAVEQSLFEQPDLKNYAGGPVRRTSRQASTMTTGEVLVENMKRMNINILLRPFQERNSQILKFTEYFLKVVCKRPGANIKRIENLLQAIVRNPILKQEYGPNSPVTADSKGFNRHLFDTGQMFKAIRAKVRRK